MAKGNGVCPAMGGGKNGRCLYLLCKGPKMCLREVTDPKPYFKRVSKLEPNPGPDPKKRRRK